MVASLNVIVIEDDDFLRDSIVELLNTQGHVVRGYFCADEMDQTVKYSAADLYVIDINLPGENGFQLAARLRNGQPNAGIIMFTARTAIADRINGYKHGADVYLPKPVDPMEFLSVVEALSRRLKPDDADQLKLQFAARIVEGPEGIVKVTASEAMLLSHFISAPSQFLEYWQVMSCLFGEKDSNKASMEVRVVYLRKKLISIGASSPVFQAAGKQGYTLVSKVILC